MHGGGGESVREHRNYLFQVARHGGAGKGSECGRSKSDKLGQEGPLRSDRVIKHPVWSGMVK